MEYEGFVGPSNTLRSAVHDVERTVNFYLESAAPGRGASNYRLAPTPGMTVFVNLGTGPVRDVFYQDGRGFAVAGATFYEFFASQTFVARGAVTVDGNPAVIASNGTIGNQLIIWSGGNGYIYDLVANTLTQIADPDFITPASMGAFLDTYFVSLARGTRKFQYSKLADGTDWNSLDVNEVSQSADDLQSLLVTNRDVWLFGSKTTAVWADVGDVNNPFQPIPGAFIQHGVWAPYSPRAVNGVPFWLGSSEQGTGVVYRAQGYVPQRVSTHAVEYRISKHRTDDAVGFQYQREGHAFYVLYFPDGDVHWCYDLTTDAWHEWALWDDVYGRWLPHLSRCQTFGFGRNLVGDRQSGAIYELRLDIGYEEVV